MRIGSDIEFKHVSSLLIKSANRSANASKKLIRFILTFQHFQTSFNG